GDSVSVINTATDTAPNAPITSNIGAIPLALAITPDGTKVYVANFYDDSVSVINTATDTAPNAPITSNIGDGPRALAITPDGTKAYVANQSSDSVSVINTATDMVSATITSNIGNGPIALAIATFNLTERLIQSVVKHSPIKAQKGILFRSN
ncbi:hypothetical protein COB11_03370, partial [Candidatus Aerophobetes bacterium]